MWEFKYEDSDRWNPAPPKLQHSLSTKANPLFLTSGLATYKYVLECSTNIDDRPGCSYTHFKGNAMSFEARIIYNIEASIEVGRCDFANTCVVKVAGDMIQAVISLPADTTIKALKLEILSRVLEKDTDGRHSKNSEVMIGHMSSRMTLKSFLPQPVIKAIMKKPGTKAEMKKPVIKAVMKKPVKPVVI